MSFVAAFFPRFFGKYAFDDGVADMQDSFLRPACTSINSGRAI